MRLGFSAFRVFMGLGSRFRAVCMCTETTPEVLWHRMLQNHAVASLQQAEELKP